MIHLCASVNLVVILYMWLSTLGAFLSIFNECLQKPSLHLHVDTALLPVVLQVAVHTHSNCTMLKLPLCTPDMAMSQY